MTSAAQRRVIERAVEGGGLGWTESPGCFCAGCLAVGSMTFVEKSTKAREVLRAVEALLGEPFRPFPSRRITNSPGWKLALYRALFWAAAERERLAALAYAERP